MSSQLSKREHKPWGYYRNLTKGNGCLVKKIVIFPNEMTSLQSHAHRREHWYVVSGDGAIVVGELNYQFNPGDSIDIDAGVKHRIVNVSQRENLIIIEIQQGSPCSEEDIIRYEDKYGRVR
jgi:mannose-6-phosphate isomerase-like protein (cupin superfamily)